MPLPEGDQRPPKLPPKPAVPATRADAAATAAAAARATVTSGGSGVQGAALNPANLNYYVNPPVDPRLNDILKKLGSPLVQGIIQQTPEAVVSPQRYPYACRFHFNPTTISVGYGGPDETLVNPANKTAAELAAVDLTPGRTTISWSLFFDRTYEVAYGPTATNPFDLRKIGVYADIGALENIVGARDQFAVDPKSVLRSMSLKSVYVIFGGGSGEAGLSFIGSLTSMSVTYTLFSERMVPTRAVVELSMTQLLGQDLGELRRQGGNLLQRAQDRSRRQIVNGQNLPRPNPPRGL